MDKPPHTPTPWHLNNALLSVYAEPDEDGKDRLILDMPVGPGKPIPKSVQSQEDAVFIVKAVNAHYELERIAALASKIDIVWEDDEAHDPGEWDELLKELRQALRPWRAKRAGATAIDALLTELESETEGEPK